MRIIDQENKLSIDELHYTISVVGYAVLAKTKEVTYTLGAYKTSDRAAEVFNELHAAYEELPFSGNSVYRMPKK